MTNEGGTLIFSLAMKAHLPVVFIRRNGHDHRDDHGRKILAVPDRTRANHGDRGTIRCASVGYHDIGNHYEYTGVHAPSSINHLPRYDV